MIPVWLQSSHFSISNISLSLSSLPFSFSFSFFVRLAFRSISVQSINISCCHSNTCLSITETRHTSGPIHHSHYWPGCKIVCERACVLNRSFVSADNVRVIGLYKGVQKLRDRNKPFIISHRDTCLHWHMYAHTLTHTHTHAHIYMHVSVHAGGQ